VDSSIPSGLGDDSVLEKALTESRLLITFDKDFGELVFHKGAEASWRFVSHFHAFSRRGMPENCYDSRI